MWRGGLIHAANRSFSVGLRRRLFAPGIRVRFSRSPHGVAANLYAEIHCDQRHQEASIWGNIRC